MDTIKLTDQIQNTTQFLIDTLDSSIMGIYLYGSYVDGGLKHKSDIDIFVVINSNLKQEKKDTLVQGLLSLSGAIDNKENKRYLEVTIINQNEFNNLHFPIHREFQYGEWLRQEYTKGYIPERVIDQDLTILLRKIRNNSITLYGEPANELLPHVSNKEFDKAIRLLLPGLIEELEDDTTNVILTLCRMYYSLKTGQITSKDKAIDYILDYIPDRFKSMLIDTKNSYIGKETLSEQTNLSLAKEFSSYITRRM